MFFLLRSIAFFRISCFHNIARFLSRLDTSPFSVRLHISTRFPNRLWMFVFSLPENLVQLQNSFTPITSPSLQWSCLIPIGYVFSSSLYLLFHGCLFFILECVFCGSLFNLSSSYFYGPTATTNQFILSVQITIYRTLIKPMLR